jgi:phenylacetate-CoA ligase
MIVSSGDRDVADRWEHKRWADFKTNLIKVSQSNRFQESHFPSLKSLDDWGSFEDFISACPFTTKDDLAKDRDKNPPYGTNLTFPLSEYKKFNQTSGTQGKPMAWLDTMEDWRWMLGNWDRVMEAARVNPEDRCFFAFSFGPFLGFWTAYEAATQRGCICIPAGGQSTEQRLHGIMQQKAEHLFCTPTYAMRLTSFAQESGIDLQGHELKSIIVAGETGGSLSAVRERICSAWGNDIRIHDHYGMTEVGPVAYETPGGQGGLRVILDSYFAEVIDPQTLKPVKDGEQGELVLTTLGRVGCPVFRYRTGDLVRGLTDLDEMGLPTFDLVGGILGRTDDMVVVRGVNLYPSAIDAVLARFSEIKEYQVIIENRDDMLEARIKVECDQEIRAVLEAAFQESFSLRIPVEVVASGSLPRHEMKARRWIKPGQK